MSTLPSTQELAFAFARKLREYLDADDMEQVIDLNDAETNPRICHSGDFCDSNVLMAEAWQELTGAEHDLQDDAHVARWNEAWNLAKETDFETEGPDDDERSNGRH